MKRLSIVPLQSRTTKELGRENSSFMCALSVMSPILISYVITSLTQILFVLWFSSYSMNHKETALVTFLIAHSKQVSAIVNVFAMFAGVLFVLPQFYKEAVRFRMPTGRKRDFIPLCIVGLSSAYCSNYLVGLLQKLELNKNYQSVAETQFSLPFWVGIIIYGFFSPLAEEIVFRGLVYNRFRRQYSGITAVVASSLLFGLYHGNMIQTLYGTVLGIIIAVLYERYGSFLVPVFLHSVANVGVYWLMNQNSIKNIFMTAHFCFLFLVITVFLLIVLLKENRNHYSLDK